MRLSLFYRAFWLMLVVFAIGCGNKKTVKVEGVVKVDGKPASGVMVKFVSQDKGGRDANGFTDDDGVFQLTTANTNDGAIPGSYKVTLSKSKGIGNTAAPNPNDPEAMAKAMREFNEKNKGGGPEKSLLPEIFSKADTTTLKYEIPYDGKIEIEIKSTAGK
jgi:hypothetical protein